MGLICLFKNLGLTFHLPSMLGRAALPKVSSGGRHTQPASASTSPARRGQTASGPALPQGTLTWPAGGTSQLSTLLHGAHQPRNSSRCTGNALQAATARKRDAVLYSSS